MDYQYKDSMVVGPSYFYNGKSCIGKVTSIYHEQFYIFIQIHMQ